MSDALPPSRFQAAYEGTPPWDIGRPQRSFKELLDKGGVRGPILDVGCGTGENALAFAAAGYEVTGVDIIARAIDKARDKARERGVSATFEVADALELGKLQRSFSSVVDSAVFHVFNDEDRVRYVASLAHVLEPGGRYYMLSFSDAEPTDWGGPRRISRAEIEEAFRDGWKIESIEPTRLETTFHENGGHAWFATVLRTR
ncbi:MAG: class I SAM-dependent methyltransferase [Polyangiaceae bacterium]|nr:class I SAM-dependent methyltransferase [Polyangiaceae bacterium]